MKPTRVPINIDPEVREALVRHLYGKYEATGVGYSEFIRRAIVADGGEVPATVQPDNRYLLPPTRAFTLSRLAAAIERAQAGLVLGADKYLPVGRPITGWETSAARIFAADDEINDE